MGFKTVYWDACVFHALFGAEPGRIDSCAKIEKAAASGEVRIYTSAVTFVECAWIKTIVDGKGKMDKLSHEHEEKIQNYFMRSYIVPINCDRLIAEWARSLLWKYALHPKDAIHVASALSQQVDVMHSYDNDILTRLNGQIGNPPLKICNPGDGDGFDPALTQVVAL